MNKRKRVNKWILAIIMAILILISVGIVLNWGWIYDWYRGVVYRPEANMLMIKDKLGLTGEGEFLFNAAQPVLNEAKDFNQNCRQEERETAV